MINSELKKSSIANLLVQHGNLRAEGKVRTEYKVETMNLTGFIPYTNYFMQYEYLVMNVDLNTHLYVAPFLVKFSEGGPVFPYFKYIAVASEKKYHVDGNLYADTVLDSIPEQVVRSARCNVPFNGRQMLRIMRNRRMEQYMNLFEKIDDENYNYLGREGEYVLSGGLGNTIAISKDCLCLCSYVNNVTGRISYVVLPSDEVIKVLPEEEYE